MGSTFLIAGEHLADGEPDFQRTLAAAHFGRTRPLCLCKPEGVETCVAAASEGFFVRRMPYTAAKHAGSCLLARTWPYSRPISPRIRVLADSGDFATFRAESQALGALLRSLWHSAGLTCWRPSFDGKRSWANVRRHLRTGSAGHDWRGGALGDCLYIPETFCLEEKDAIGARRGLKWARAAQRRIPRNRVVLIGEVKRIVYATQRCAFVIKHVPDRPFVLSDKRYSWINRVCGDDAAFCEMFDDLRLVAIATVALSSKLEPALCCVHLMPTTAEWLPIRNDRERATVAGLIRQGRSFTVDESLFVPRREPKPWRPDATNPSAALAP